MACVLLINDEADLLEMCALVLGSVGHSVSRAIGGRRGIELALRQQPDVILLDLVMPQMSGEDVLAELRAGVAAGVPVVVMSALADGKARAERMHANGFLAKPFDAETLIATVERALPDGATTERREE